MGRFDIVVDCGFDWFGLLLGNVEGLSRGGTCCQEG